MKLKTKILDPEKIELGGYQSENGNWYVDEENPLITIAEYERKTELSNKKTDTSYMKLPHVNVDLEGAKSVSAHIKADYTEKYESFFKKPDDRIVKVDYSYEIAQDTIAILISEEVTTPKESGTITYVYYYDILVDSEESISTYAGICGSSLYEIMEGLIETDWAKDYLTVTGFEPNDSCITALTFNPEDETFDVYCINTDGISQTVVTVTPVEQEIDFSQFQPSEQ
ncbi:MAG: hypothetical protein IKU52_06990 [Clostridia bacterium]|nr:hypothetical protein [Clostridia bacterium]